jgi:hypothetical protein
MVSCVRKLLHWTRASAGLTCRLFPERSGVKPVGFVVDFATGLSSGSIAPQLLLNSDLHGQPILAKRETVLFAALL